MFDFRLSESSRSQVLRAALERREAGLRRPADAEDDDDAAARDDDRLRDARARELVCYGLALGVLVAVLLAD